LIISRHLYRRYFKKNIVWFFLSLVLNIGLLLVVSSKIDLKENINRLNDNIVELKYKIYQDSLTIDSLKNLNLPFHAPIEDGDKKINIYITFNNNDSISGHYMSPQGITYILKGKGEMDSLYQGVMININNVTQENYFHFNINSNNKISGDFTVGDKTVRINKNVIVNDSEVPTTKELELVKPEKKKKDNPPKEIKSKETQEDKRKVTDKRKPKNISLATGIKNEIVTNYPYAVIGWIKNIDGKKIFYKKPFKDKSGNLNFYNLPSTLYYENNNGVNQFYDKSRSNSKGFDMRFRYRISISSDTNSLFFLKTKNPTIHKVLSKVQTIKIY
jgi:hypothetical protein